MIHQNKYKMEKTTEKSRKISEIIQELKKWKDEEGDMEVFMVYGFVKDFDGAQRFLQTKYFKIWTPTWELLEDRHVQAKTLFATPDVK